VIKKKGEKENPSGHLEKAENIGRQSLSAWAPILGPFFKSKGNRSRKVGESGSIGKG